MCPSPVVVGSRRLSTLKHCIMYNQLEYRLHIYKEMVFSNHTHNYFQSKKNTSNSMPGQAAHHRDNGRPGAARLSILYECADN